jgi:hypothetical protein
MIEPAYRIRAWEWLDALVSDDAAAGVEITPEHYVSLFHKAFSIGRRECATEGETL